MALVAAAGQPELSDDDAAAMERAYFPWIGALHVLLDSLIDQPTDAQAGHQSLMDHYRSPDEAAVRLAAIAAAAFAAARELRGGYPHAMLLAAMTGFYLSAPEARLPHAVAAGDRVIATMGGLTAPTITVLRGRRALGTLLERTT